MDTLDIVKRFIELHKTPDLQQEYFYNKVFKQCQLNEFRTQLVQYLKTKDKKIYIYMVTFTLRNKKDYPKAKEYIYRQHLRKQLGVNSFHVVEELTKSGTPHWHVAIRTEKPLKKNRFNYYTKLYGHVDLSRTKGQTIDSVINYMSKSEVPEQLK